MVPIGTWHGSPNPQTSLPPFPNNNLVPNSLSLPRDRPIEFLRHSTRPYLSTRTQHRGPTNPALHFSYNQLQIQCKTTKSTQCRKYLFYLRTSKPCQHQLRQFQPAMKLPSHLAPELADHTRHFFSTGSLPSWSPG